MKTVQKLLRSISIFGIIIMFLFNSCSKKEEEKNSIIEVLSSDSNLSTFVAALEYSGISGILQDNSPFTVFAPDNAAFDQLFIDLGVSGFADIANEDLISILTYHIVYAEFTTTYFANGFINTLSEGPQSEAMVLLLNATESTLCGNVNITEFDIMASNGVIHLIDKVLLPPTIFDILSQQGGFTHLIAAVRKAEMESMLNATGPYTIFAPTDNAFTTLFTNLGISGIADMTKEQLVPILEYHIVNGNIKSNYMVAGYLASQNGDIFVEIGTGIVLNSFSNVIGFDLQGKNGVVHVIDKVLIPEK